jgi:hypothetical protein
MAFSPIIYNLEKDQFCSPNCILLLQVSCLWQGQYLLTVSLSGFINYLDVNNPDKHIRIIKVIIRTCSGVIHCPTQHVVELFTVQHIVLDSE